MGGRGAWSLQGKDNGLRQYTYVPGMPLDGDNKDKSAAHYAVNLGVKAIQQELNKQKLLSYPLIVDGLYGAKSAAGVKEAQRKLGVTVDGKVGAVFAKRLWRTPIRLAAEKAGIDPKYLYGKMSHESSGDPAACGYYNEPDRGLTQINTAVHKNVSIEEAHNVKFNLDYTANRFAQALEEYASKPARQINAAILQHNSPSSADTYFRTGVYPKSTNKPYVEAVLRYASEW